METIKEAKLLPVREGVFFLVETGRYTLVEEFPEYKPIVQEHNRYKDKTIVFENRYYYPITIPRPMIPHVTTFERSGANISYGLRVDLV